MVSRATGRRKQSLRLVVAAGVLGYLIGSVPAADIASRYSARRKEEAQDLREVGTGNPGAVNAIKMLGPAWGGLVFAADIAKGALACWLGRRIAGANGAYAAGATAVLGHCAPVWSGFRGGKGVATSVGTCLVCFPIYAPIDVGLAVVLFTLSGGRAGLATYTASACFVAAATYWWLGGKRNAWGPEATIGLPLYALASSALIAYRFLAAPSPADEGERQAKEPAEQEAAALA